MKNPIIANAVVVSLVLAALLVVLAAKRPPAAPEAPATPAASRAPTAQGTAPLASPSTANASHAESAVSTPAGKLGAPVTPTASPRLLELGSTTCIPCKQMVPVLDALRSEYGGRLTVEFVDVLADRAAGERYNVDVIPTQVFFDAHGKELGRHQGYWPKEEILGQFSAYGVELEPASPKGAGT